MRSVTLVACVGLLLATVLPAARAHAAAPPKVSGPFEHANLSVYLVHGADESRGKRYITLQEALEQKKAIVHETGNVSELAIENVSDDLLFIQSGEIVKGGKQDRTLGSDMIITKAMGKTPIASFCVEQGRWTRRGSESQSQFSASDAMVAGQAMKAAANSNFASADQNRVWSAVAEQQEKLKSNTRADVVSSVSPSSFQLTLESEAVVNKTAEYEKAMMNVIDGKEDVVGWAYTVNGKLVGANVYSSPQLFRKLWPKLLKSACVEAIAESSEKPPTTQPVTSVQDVHNMLTHAANAKSNVREINARTRIIGYEQEHLDLYQCDDRDGVWVHRSFLTKDASQPASRQPRLAPQSNAPVQQEQRAPGR